MKIYINHFNLEKIPNIINSLTDKLIKIKNYVHVYAIDGIYQVDSLKITKLTSIDNDVEILTNYFDPLTLIVDKSYFIEEITNSITPEHICKNMQKSIYKICKNSFIALIIERDVTLNSKDIYLDIPNYVDINDVLIKKEIIVFLSLLI
jgi:hypothetical protein